MTVDKGNLELATLLKVIQALGLCLWATPIGNSTAYCCIVLQFVLDRTDQLPLQQETGIPDAPIDAPITRRKLL